MASYNPGTYEGTGRGYGGKLIVSVTVSENRIESVKVTQHKEYRGIAWGLNTTPMERYPKLIVEYQTLNIPTVDGADLTCAAILDATAAALKAAGASKEDIAALKAAPAPKAPEYQDEVRTVDVVVCGAGAGGLAAAIEAKLAGAEVVIVEKQGITGGATARSGGKLLGAGTKWQKKQGLYDNTDMVYDYLMDVGNRNGKFMDESKNRYLVDHLNQTLDWLTSIEATVKGDPAEVLAEPWQPLSKPVEKDGVLKTHFDVLDVEPIHVSLQPWRVHNSPGGGGQTNGEGGEISTPLTLYYENDLGGEIIYDTAMNEILTDEAGVVTGVTCTRKGGAKLTLYAKKGVILATGGYARNKEMVARYPVAHYFSNVPHGNVGDGLTAAEKIGALNYEHPAVQVVYTSLTCGIGINDESGLIVNDRGERLMIYRNGRWDLPKGHWERGETIEACALREVREETGVAASIRRHLCDTLHCYQLRGEWEMKRTHWFEMAAAADATLRPQTEEGIDRVCWCTPDEVELHLQQTFPTIRRVFAKL